ncbi:hypothetical protein WDU94_000295 [Cyamophila willieti]
MCKQWWKVCFLLNSSQQAQEKYYRQLYGKQRQQNQAQRNEGELPSIKTAASTKITKLKEDTNFSKPIKNIYSKLFVKNSAAGDASTDLDGNHNYFSNSFNEADLTLGSTSVVSAHNDVGLYDISDLFSRNPNFYDDIGLPYPVAPCIKSYEPAAPNCENYENVENYEHVDDSYYDLLQIKRALNPNQMPKKKYSINVYNLENSRLHGTSGVHEKSLDGLRSHDDADLPQLPPCSSKYNSYNSSLPRNFLSTNYSRNQSNRSLKNVDFGSPDGTKITDPSQLLRNLKENLYSIEQQYKEEDLNKSGVLIQSGMDSNQFQNSQDSETFPTNSLTNLQIDILRNSPLLYEEKPRSRTLDLSRPLSKIYEDPQQASEEVEAKKSTKQDATLKRQSKRVNFNLHVNYEKPKNLENYAHVGEINGIIRKSSHNSESDKNGEDIYASTSDKNSEVIYATTSELEDTKEDLYGSTNREDLYESTNISMNLMKITDYNDDTYESEYPNHSELFGTNNGESPMNNGGSHTPFNSPYVGSTPNGTYQSPFTHNGMSHTPFNTPEIRPVSNKLHPKNVSHTPFNSPQIELRESDNLDRNIYSRTYTSPNIGNSRGCTNSNSGDFGSLRKSAGANRNKVLSDEEKVYKAELPSEENIYDTLDNVRSGADFDGSSPNMTSLSGRTFGLYATTNISNLSNPGLYLKSTNVDTLSSEYIMPPVQRVPLELKDGSSRGPCAGFCALLENG